MHNSFCNNVRIYRLEQMIRMKMVDSFYQVELLKLTVTKKGYFKLDSKL